MESILAFVDEYTLKARFLPACIAGLPLMALIASYFNWNESLVANIVVGFLVGLIVIYLFSLFARSLGRRVESKILKEWGGFPTTQFLRHSDSTLSSVKKEKIHGLLAQKSEISLPSLAQENIDPDQADQKYNEAVTWLRNNTRGDEYKILLNENIAYGFFRNSLGLKWLAIILCILILIILFILFKIHYPHETYELNLIIEFSKTVKLALWLTLGLSIVMPFYWIFVITKKSMRSNAETYAKTLLDLSYNV
jgi:uncharacterized integral membrane protein